MTSSTLTATAWVIATLKADPTIAAKVGARVYKNELPAQTTPVYPYIVVTKVPGDPQKNAYGDIIWFDDLVQLDIYDKSTSDYEAGKLLDRVISLFNKANGSTADGTVVASEFMSELPFPAEVEGAVIYQRKSGEIRVFSQ